MRVLVTWGSKRGGTAGIGRMIADGLRARGIDVVAEPAARARGVEGFDAAIVGGALYANRWPASVRRFVNHHVKELRQLPVWFFSSGPLDDSADRAALPPTRQVSALAERVGAQGHVTFGGRLAPDARGFPASAMAKKRSGDWRNPDRVRAWAAQLADGLPTARRRTPVDHPARSLGRLVAYGVAGWALCAATMALLLGAAGLGVALFVHALAAPVFFVLLGRRYFRAPGARDPVPTAAAWTAIVFLLDLVVVAGAVQHSLRMFGSIAGTWLPFVLIFSATWAMGELTWMVPGPPEKEPPHRDATAQPGERPSAIPSPGARDWRSGAQDDHPRV